MGLLDDEIDRLQQNNYSPLAKTGGFSLDDIIDSAEAQAALERQNINTNYSNENNLATLGGALGIGRRDRSRGVCVRHDVDARSALGGGDDPLVVRKLHGGSSSDRRRRRRLLCQGARQLRAGLSGLDA
mgnify:CR=1 FL=1